MKVDQNPFPAHTHMFELNNSKVLIRSNQAKSTKGKNVIIGEERSELSKSHQEAPAKKVPEDSLKNSTLGGARKEQRRQVCSDWSDRSLWEFWKEFQKQERKRKAEF